MIHITRNVHIPYCTTVFCRFTVAMQVANELACRLCVRCGCRFRVRSSSGDISDIHFLQSPRFIEGLTMNGLGGTARLYSDLYSDSTAHVVASRVRDSLPPLQGIVVSNAVIIQSEIEDRVLHKLAPYC